MKYIYRYIIVGFGAVLIDTIIYFFLGFVGFFSFETSKKISFMFGSIFRFIMNRNYVFKAKKKILFQIFSFPILYLATFLVKSSAHDYIFSITRIPTISFLFATSLSTTLNFLGQ